MWRNVRKQVRAFGEQKGMAASFKETEKATMDDDDLEDIFLKNVKVDKVEQADGHSRSKSGRVLFTSLISGGQRSNWRPYGHICAADSEHVYRLHKKIKQFKITYASPKDKVQ